MEDSPLSITTSIAGILTFIAAICAFIYVRYNTLRNGWTEIDTIVESIVATIEETRAIAQAGQVTQSGDDPDSRRLKELVTELYSTELAILAHCMNVYAKDVGKTLGTIQARMQSSLRPSGSTRTTWAEVVKEVQEAQKRWQHGRIHGLRAIERYFKVMDVFIQSQRYVDE